MSIASKDVYTGLWTDWSKGNQVLGSTITLTSSSSRLLGAFLALYVSLSVSYFWLLIVYNTHRARYSFTTSKCRAIVRQQQALLKAGLSPASTCIRLLKLYWAYRFTPLAWHHSWLWISISAMSAASSIAAGLFSSQIIDSSLYINVLTDSSNCGVFDPYPITSEELNDPKLTASHQNVATLVDLATVYGRDCYNSTSSKSQCNFFSSTTIPWETEWEAECPFGDMCIGPAMRMDTGLLNSNSLLGINSPTIDQIELRKITSCAPIRQEGYTETVSVDTDGGAWSDLPGNQIVSYLYGETTGENPTWAFDMYGANSTTVYTMVNQYYYSSGPLSSGDEYQWIPIPELNNTQGDGTLIFISSNAILFTEPCDDPVFSAHVSLDTANKTLYLEDNIAGVLGCLEQYQMCDAGANKCSTVGPFNEVYQEFIENMGMTRMQMGTAYVTAMAISDLSSIREVTGVNTHRLVASRGLIADEIQLPLPSNQWQIEVQFWHSTIMAMIQYVLLEYMIGPNDADLQQYVKAPASPETRALCKRQRIRISQGFANVSSLGLFFTISLGTVVILLALFLDNIMGCVTRLSKGDGKKHRAWIRDDVLHLQRLAYRQEQSFGPLWIATNDSNIPLVEGNGFLDPLVDPQEVKIDNTHSRLSVDSLMDDSGTL